MGGVAARGELVHFESTDGLRLSGLLFEPRRSDAPVVVWLHGNGDASVFTSPRTKILAAGLLRRGIAFLPFDNRGSHLIKRFRRTTAAGSERVEIGMTRELIDDAVHDIRGAIRFVRSRGYASVHLAGHSTGANKICVYEASVARSGARSNILVAPGDDVGLYREELGAGRFEAALERARREIARGRGDRLIPPAFSPFPLSWNSFLDTIDPDGSYNVFPFREEMTGEQWSSGSLFRRFSALRRPTLAVMGTDDEYCFGDAPRCLEILDAHAPRNYRSVLVEGADHGFGGREDVLAGAIAHWVRDHL